MQENVIKISEIIEQRMDPFFYRNEFISLDSCLTAKQYKKLEDLCYQITDGTHYTPSYVEQGVKFLSVKNVRENEIYFDKDTKYITKEEHEKLKKRAFPQANDILLTKIGATYGYAAVIPAQVEEFSIFVSLALLKVKREIIDSKYLSIVLNSRIAKRQMDRVIKGVGVPDLHLEDIRNLKIPMIKNPEIVISIMDSAYQQKKDKELQAQNLLASIDDFVLNVLSINLPPFNKEKAYTTKISNILGSRFDSDYNQEYFSYIYNSLTQSDYDILKNLLVYYKKGIEVGTSRYTEQGMPFIRVSDFNSYGLTYSDNTKFISVDYFNELKDFSPQIGDILFSKDGTIGNSLLIDKNIDGIISGGIIRLHPSNDKVNPQYLSAMLSLNIYKQFFDRNSIGAIIKHLNIEELLNLPIPLPSKDIQDKIANYVIETIKEAKTLQEEAKSGLERAKQEVEKILLGE